MIISNWSFWSILTFGIYCSRKPKDITEIPDMPKGYADYFEKNLQPLSGKFEQMRKRTLFYLGLRFWSIVLILLSCLYLVNFGDINSIIYCKILIFIAIILSLINIRQKYQKALYKEVLSRIVRFYGDFNFSFSVPIKVHEYNNSRIIPAYNYENSKNYIYGNYKGLAIEQFYTKLIRKIDKENHVQVFAGLVLKIKIKKKFSGITVLKKDHGLLFNWINTESDLSKVRLEDPNFEKVFEVFASDQIEARYLLTTIFMERLLDFRTAMNTKSMTVSFFDQHILLLISKKKPIFTTSSITEPADFTSDSSLLLPEMRTLLSTIDILKLDQEIGF